MTARRSPRRTCIGCRTSRPQADLVRVAISGDGRIVVSRTAPGRGAWLCDPPQDCLTTAVRRHAFARAFRRPVTDQMIDQLQHELERAPGSSNTAGEPISGGPRGERGRGTE
jgi:predicted RNA-binding protein YlxR (DUF448 family)